MTGSERTLRETLVRLIHQAGIFGLRDENLDAAFISGDVNPRLRDIGIDSLSEMELCIGIESELGVSIVPAELEKLEDLETLVIRIAKFAAPGR
jgi:acyl carrier protein